MFALFSTVVVLKPALISLIILGSAILLERTTRFFLRRFFHRNSLLLKVDPTRYIFLKNAISFTIYSLAFIGIVYTIPAFRSLGLTLAAGAGVFAAILGFASQAALSNIVGGVFIVMFKPFRVGDMIQVGEMNPGIVEDITLRHVVIRTFDNRRIVIPNSVISEQTILNSSLADEKICQYVEFTISFESDVDLAEKLIREEAQKHPLMIDGRTEEEIAEGLPLIRVRMIAHEDSGVRLRAYVWAKDPFDAFDIRTDMYRTVKKRFDESGVEIPYPHRSVVMKQGRNT